MTQYTHLNQTERNIIANMSASGHTNGLARQYTPKKTSMAHIDAFLGEFVEPNKTGTEHAKTSK